MAPLQQQRDEYGNNGQWNNGIRPLNLHQNSHFYLHPPLQNLYLYLQSEEEEEDIGRLEVDNNEEQTDMNAEIRELMLKISLGYCGLLIATQFCFGFVCLLVCLLKNST